MWQIFETGQYNCSLFIYRKMVLEHGAKLYKKLATNCKWRKWNQIFSSFKILKINRISKKITWWWGWIYLICCCVQLFIYFYLLQMDLLRWKKFAKPVNRILRISSLISFRPQFRLYSSDFRTEISNYFLYQIFINLV